MTNNKKYKLGERHSNRNLYRVIATTDFAYIRKDAVGGWVASEKNLSQEGTCWVDGESVVQEDVRVYGDAKVYEHARVSGRAKIYGQSLVFGDAQVTDNVHIYENAWVSGTAQVYRDARVKGYARLDGSARVFNDIWAVSPLQIRGTVDFLTTSSFTTVIIGERIKSIDEWLKDYSRILKEQLFYTDDQVEEYGDYLRLADRFLAKRREEQKRKLKELPTGKDYQALEDLIILEEGE